MKTVRVSPDNRNASEVVLNRHDEADELTPAMARAAMEIATGNAQHSGSVSDAETMYRITTHSVRRVGCMDEIA